MSDEEVIVIGVDTPRRSETRPAPPRRRRPWVAAMVPALVGLVVWAVVGAGDPQGAETVETLAPPDEPVVAVDATVATATPSVPEAVLGWHGTYLAGYGTVTSVSHGPSGWIGAADQGLRTIALTSGDGVVWSASTIPSERGGSSLATAATSRGFVVVSSDWERSAVRSWHSSDGATWSSSPLPNDVGIEGVTEASGDLFAFGMVQGSDGLSDVGTAWVARFDGRSWLDVPMAIADPDRSKVTAVTAIETGVAAVGYDGGVFTVWVGDGRSFDERLDLDMEDRHRSLVPLSVTELGDGSWVALCGRSMYEANTTVMLTSTDLRRWEAVEPSDVPLVAIAPFEGGILGYSTDIPLRSLRLWDGNEWETVATSYRTAYTGMGDITSVASIASSGELTVIGGTARLGQPALWTRGALQPVIVMPQPDPGSGYWEVVDRWSAPFDSDRLSAAAAGSEVILATSAGLVVFDEASGTLSPSLVGPYELARVGEDVYAIERGNEAERTVMYRRLANGLWRRETIPRWPVRSISTDRTGTPVALVGDVPMERAVRDGSGTWTISGDIVSGLGSGQGLTAAAWGGFVSRTGTGLRWSPDGVAWEPATLEDAFVGNQGILVASGAPGEATAIGLVDGSWPDVTWIEAPELSPRSLESGGPVLSGSTHDSVERFEGGSWVSYPVGLEWGVAPPDWIVLPTSEPTIATIGGGTLTISRWMAPIAG